MSESAHCPRYYALQVVVGWVALQDTRQATPPNMGCLWGQACTQQTAPPATDSREEEKNEKACCRIVQCAGDLSAVRSSQAWSTEGGGWWGGVGGCQDTTCNEGVGLAAAGLTVSQDGAVAALQDGCHDVAAAVKDLTSVNAFICGTRCERTAEFARCRTAPATGPGTSLSALVAACPSCCGGCCRGKVPGCADLCIPTSTHGIVMWPVERRGRSPKMRSKVKRLAAVPPASLPPKLSSLLLMGTRHRTPLSFADGGRSRT